MLCVASVDRPKGCAKRTTREKIGVIQTSTLLGGRCIRKIT